MGLKYVDEYRDPGLAKGLIASITARSRKPARFMEICGTHTVAIFRSGLRGLLPAHIQLVSGPGCPVCVTAAEDIDRFLWLARQPGVIVTTFGDLLRVPGSTSSLQKERSEGADVRMVYSSFDALRIAVENPERQVVLLGVGFETTAPTVAAAVKKAAEKSIGNFSVYCAHKLLPPAMETLLSSGEMRLDGFICPGHVSTVIGARAYEAVAARHRLPCVVTGFEPIDLLQGIGMLVEQVESGGQGVFNQYRRAVSYEGNATAQGLMAEVFEPCGAAWRGLGRIPESGLRLRAAWERFDAAERFSLPDITVDENPACRCGDVLRGAIRPPECGLFGRACTPERPLGPCMASGEGTCGAYHRFRGQWEDSGALGEAGGK
ncbi:MAG: hydrogenase formation protein HypD [Syntrophobacteraceae bacterium]